MKGIINKEALISYLECPHRCFLKLTGQKGKKTDYSKFESERADEYRLKARKRIEEKLLPGRSSRRGITILNKRSDVSIVFNLNIRQGPYQILIDAMTFEDSNVNFCTPLFFIHRNKINANDKLLLGIIHRILLDAKTESTNYGRIFHGEYFTNVKVHFTRKLTSQATKMLNSVKSLLEFEDAPVFNLSKKCTQCEYSSHCLQLALERDDLSLIRNMSAKEIDKLNNKGIFTINQLAYTFRPKMVSRKGFCDKPKHFHSLKALAIRDKKTYVVDGFDIRDEGASIYLDIEGIPDRDFFYLIGMVISDGEAFRYEHLWSDNEEDEEKTWRRLLDFFSNMDEFTIYHYGSYDSKFIKKMCRKYDVKERFAEKIQESMVNVLNVIYYFVYFPTYENDLKSIGNYLGFTRKSEIQTGLQSIVARVTWEENRQERLKKNLIKYNEEDCILLKLVADVVKHLIHRNEDAPISLGSIVRTDDIPNNYPNLYKKIDFYFEEFDKINDRAYFDYQRSKVFFRTNKAVKRSNIRKAQKLKNKAGLKKLKINQIVTYKRPTKCIYCGLGWPYLNVKIDKIVYDLKITKHGIKRWVVCNKCGIYKCRDRQRKGCKKVFSVPNSFRYNRYKFGKILCGYVIYLAVHHNMTLRSISAQLFDLFGYTISHGSILQIRNNASNDYLPTYNGILKSLLKSRLIHVDETPVLTKEGKAYIWILTNFEQVYYFFTKTREGTKAKELLSDFRGVLVSDFFALYDSFKCPQQKCHIHLIRDINDELKKNPLDKQLSKIATGYKDLFSPIVDTIDRFGLKQYHLNKHKKQVHKFYKKFIDLEYSNLPATALQKRFDKHREQLFTFLDYDGVPWNNNNAEHAVKPIVKTRLKKSGLATEKSMNEILVLLSIRETLKLRGHNVFQFFISGKKEIEK